NSGFRRPARLRDRPNPYPAERRRSRWKTFLSMRVARARLFCPGFPCFTRTVSVVLRGCGENIILANVRQCLASFPASLSALDRPVFGHHLGPTRPMEILDSFPIPGFRDLAHPAKRLVLVGELLMFVLHFVFSPVKTRPKVLTSQTPDLIPACHPSRREDRPQLQPICAISVSPLANASRT